jgi:hypothetical protein
MRGIHRNVHTTRTRDAALRQLSRANRWLIAGSVVLTGVLADVAANAFPGKSVKSAPAKGHAGRAGSGASKTTTGVLRPPAQAPRNEEDSSQQSAPTEPAQETAPAESAPAQEAPQESAPAQEAAPAPEATPEREAPSEPAPAEESGPVVSGGS